MFLVICIVLPEFGLDAAGVAALAAGVPSLAEVVPALAVGTGVPVFAAAAGVTVVVATGVAA